VASFNEKKEQLIFLDSIIETNTQCIVVILQLANK